MPLVLDTFQKIVNAAHLKWDSVWSPPILHEPRLHIDGLQQVSVTTFAPYELYNKSSFLSNPIYFAELQRFVLALWQLKFTTNKGLVRELLQKQKSKLITKQEMISHLTWLVQHSHPRFQLCWPSVKSVHYDSLHSN